MGIVTGLLGLPLAPVRGTIALAEQIQKQAEAAYYDPAAIRQQLDEVAQQREAGELSAAEADWWEEQLINRLIEGADRERH